MTESLADKKCVPCRGGVPPLKGAEVEKLLQAVPRWTVTKDHHIHREFKFPDFQQALDFVNRVGALAEEEGHHPDILLTWGKAESGKYPAYLVIECLDRGRMWRRLRSTTWCAQVPSMQAMSTIRIFCREPKHSHLKSGNSSEAASRMW